MREKIFTNRIFLFIIFLNPYYNLLNYSQKGDSKGGPSSSIIYPPRMVPKVEPNTDPQVVIQAQRNQVLWGQPSNLSNAPSQQHQQSHCKNYKFLYDFVRSFSLKIFTLYEANICTFSATTHILPASSSENPLLQQQKPTSTQTSQQQLTSSTLIQTGPPQAPTNSQQQSAPEQGYFNTTNDTQQHTDTSQPTSVSVTTTSPVQMPQNGYEVSLSNATTHVQTQPYTQQCIGAQGAWIARGSNTLTYTQSMQPPEHPREPRALNQTYCE